MAVYAEVRAKCERLAAFAIDEANKVLLEEGGTAEVLRFLAYLTHGEILPASMIHDLREQAGRIAEEQLVASA